MGKAQPATAPEPRGRDGGRARGGGETAPVALERPEMGEHPMRRGDGLRALQMRVGRHRTPASWSACACARITRCSCADRRIGDGGGVDRPEARGGGHLIVAAASGMELGCDVAHLLVEQAVDERVDILIGRDRECARAELRGDGIESLLEAPALLERDDAGVPERDGPCLGELDVEGPEAEIDVDGAVERVELGCGVAGEAAPPELVRGAAVQLERAHAIASAGGASCAALSAAAASCLAASSWSFSARTRCGRP